MPFKYDEQTLRDAIVEAGGYQPAARLLRSRGFDISDRTLRRYFGNRDDEQQPLFELEEPMLPKIDIEKLKLRRIQEFAQKKAHYDQEKLIPVRMNIDGPIGIGFVGDPHIDDSGTDIQKLYDDIQLFDGSNEGLFATNLGDVSNNWVGRLERLWGEQSTSAQEAKALVEDYLGQANWLFYIMGNHDVWNSGADILNQILAKNSLITKENSVKTEIKFLSGKSLKIHAAHGFAGKSQWVENMGALKAAQLSGEHFDIFVAGHIHTSGYSHGIRPSTDKIFHALQVASYKAIDKYADQLGLPTKDMYNCPVALIDPYATNPINFVRFEFDPHEAAERLAWMRQRFNQGKSST